MFWGLGCGYLWGFIILPTIKANNKSNSRLDSAKELGNWKIDLKTLSRMLQRKTNGKYERDVKRHIG